MATYCNVTEPDLRLHEGVPFTDAERRVTGRSSPRARASRSDRPGIRLESVLERYVETLRPARIAIATAGPLSRILIEPRPPRLSPISGVIRR
jgi:hypothetical protein